MDMAWEKQLKSDMGGAVDSGMNTFSETNRDFPMTKEMVFAEVNGETRGDGPLYDKIMASIQSIEKQIAELKTEIVRCEIPDLNSVFSKIDSAHTTLEKLIRSLGAGDGYSENILPDKLAELETLIRAIAEKQDRNDRQLAQALRENANFQIQVRQGMQHDIDVLKEQQSGEIFNPLLREISAIYVDYQDLLKDNSISELSQRNLRALFEQLESVLVENGAEIINSTVGEIRQTRTTKIINKIPTGNQEQHNTIAASRKPGVVKGRTVLYSEFVDVYIFNPELEQKEHEIEALSEETELKEVLIEQKAARHEE